MAAAGKSISNILLRATCQIWIRPFDHKPGCHQPICTVKSVAEWTMLMSCYFVTNAIVAIICSVCSRQSQTSLTMTGSVKNVADHVSCVHRKLRQKVCPDKLRHDRTSTARYSAGGIPGSIRTWLLLRLVYINCATGQQNAMFCYQENQPRHPKVDFPGPKVPLSPAFRAKIITTIDAFADMLPRLVNLPPTSTLTSIHSEFFFDEADIRTFSVELRLLPGCQEARRPGGHRVCIHLAQTRHNGNLTWWGTSGWWATPWVAQCFPLVLAPRATVSMAS